MKEKLFVLSLLFVVIFGALALLTNVESACSPGDPCWESYSATATASAAYPGPYPGPNAIPLPCQPDQDFCKEPYPHKVYMSAILSSDSPWRGFQCIWPDISEPPPTCWCTLMEHEPPDYVPMGCDPDEVIPYGGG